MPEAQVFFYCDDRNNTPVLDWLRELKHKDLKAYASCLARIELLEKYGHELRRPHADYLRDGIYELRIKCRRVQYRILYFFDGIDVVILANGITKEDKVPPMEIERAVRRKSEYEANPGIHRY